MGLANLTIRSLTGRDCLARFDCGHHDIDSFAIKKAHKWVEQGRARVFASHFGEAPMGVGFYSLSFSTEEGNKLGGRGSQIYKDQTVPIVYLGYLGVRRPYQKNGIGTILLMDALTRAYKVSSDVAFYGVALRSLNNETTEFYKRFGFGLIEEGEPMMMIPIWTIKELVEG